LQHGEFSQPIDEINRLPDIEEIGTNAPELTLFLYFIANPLFLLLFSILLLRLHAISSVDAT
jgi:hypothetical protein